jgi:RNA polymerase sigma-70 factor (ECF subfamily)
VADREGETLLDAARSGDAGALEALLAESQSRVYRFSLKMCGDPHDAEDVVQDTLFAAARTIGGFRGASSVSTWLYTIARSFCLKKRRRSVFAPEVVSIEQAASGVEEIAAPVADPERRFAVRELAAALESAIGALEPGAREVLLLRDAEGLSAREVAEVTGLSVEAVKSRLHRARLAVRERLAPLIGTGAVPPAPAAARACPDVLGLLSRHLEGDVGPETCAEMERHVAGCPRCHAACESLRETLRLCRSTPATDLPDTVKDSIRSGIRALLARRTV